MFSNFRYCAPPKFYHKNTSPIFNGHLFKIKIWEKSCGPYVRKYFLRLEVASTDDISDIERSERSDGLWRLDGGDVFH